jgi:methyltransferase
MRLVSLAAVVYAGMLAEAVRARRNEDAQRARGGVEPAGDVYRVMQVAYPAAFAAMILEGALRGGAPASAFDAGLIVFAAAKALKWWAIVSLGQAWTFRVIVVRGAPLVSIGPYRFVRHPNYVAVIGELAGVALMSGALVAGPLGVAGFGLLISKRIAVETRALGAILASK